MLTHLVNYSGGDLRQAITLLQCLSRCVCTLVLLLFQSSHLFPFGVSVLTRINPSFRLRGEGEEITVEDVMDVAGVLPEPIINDLITQCHSNSFDKVQQVRYRALVPFHAHTLACPESVLCVPTLSVSAHTQGLPITVGGEQHCSVGVRCHHRHLTTT